SRTRFIHESIRELIEEVGDGSMSNPVVSEQSCLTQERQCPPATVVCIPARNEADEFAAMMLAQILEREGHEAQVLARGTIAKIFEESATFHPHVICISALHPLSPGQARPLCKQLREHYPKVKLLIALWEYPGGTSKAQERIGPSCADFIGTSI